MANWVERCLIGAGERSAMLEECVIQDVRDNGMLEPVLLQRDVLPVERRLTIMVRCRINDGTSSRKFTLYSNVDLRVR